MQSFRRAACRGASLSYSPPTRQLRSSFLTSQQLKQSLRPITNSQTRPSLKTCLRTFATTSQQHRDDERSTLDTARDTVEDAADSVKETATSTADSVRESIDSITPDSVRSSKSRPAPGTYVEAERDPNATLYTGNLYFEATPEALREEFSKYGDVVDSKVVYDGRGLSKGFGYVTMASIEQATKAKEALNQQPFQGRQLAIQYAKQQTHYLDRMKNPVGKTVFVGNMSYEMSDKDLNELFREVDGVLDVRVAIDRQTGQPRGFAHADFKDTAAAEKAVALLRNREFYGRKLRIDYSSSRTESSRPLQVEGDVL